MDGEQHKEEWAHLMIDLLDRHRKAARAKDEKARARYFNLIEEFRWAWPTAAADFDARYRPTD